MQSKVLFAYGVLAIGKQHLGFAESEPKCCSLRLLAYGEQHLGFVSDCSASLNKRPEQSESLLPGGLARTNLWFVLDRNVVPVTPEWRVQPSGSSPRRGRTKASLLFACSAELSKYVQTGRFVLYRNYEQTEAASFTTLRVLLAEG